MEMEAGAQTKPHAVCMPFPAQGHINAMLKLAKLLHRNAGFHITFVNTEHNRRRVLRSRGPSALAGLSDFRFEAIPDGLPSSVDPDATQDMVALCCSFQKNMGAPFRELIARLNDPAASSGVPPATCVISDVGMSFTLKATEEFKIPNLFFWSPSACSLMACLYFKDLMEKGIIPLKSEEDLENGYLDTVVDCIPGMKNLRLKDLPSYIRTTNPDDFFLNFLKDEVLQGHRSTGFILNTFHELEGPVIDALSSMLPPVYDVGPLCLLTAHQIAPDSPLASLGLSFLKEDSACVNWLDEKRERSVLYVNFGSLAVLTSHQLVELAWGLANSGYEFLWIIRPDLLAGETAVLPKELLEEIKGRCLLTSWCPQEAALAHRAVGGFFTHCGWNSTLEGLSAGVPMLCLPFIGDQQMNCWYLFNEWGVGVEVDSEVKREEVEKSIRELMGGEKGREMRMRAMEWREIAVRRSKLDGASSTNLDRAVKLATRG